jgi:PD-(D/E)XK nuclease superfamily
MNEGRRPALSISALDMLSKCGEQYRRRYIEHERIPPGVAAIVGKGVDKSVDRNLTNKIQTKALLSVEEIKDTARDAVATEWESGGVKLSEAELEAGMKATRAGAIDKAVRLSEVHAIEAAPAINPTHVQRKWVIELDGYPADLTGVIDIQEGAAAVRDTKTSAKSPREDEAHLSDQLTLYALAAKVLDGAAPALVALDYLVDTKMPKKVTRESTRDDDDFRVMLRRIETGMLAIEKGVFVPARQSDWWCSRRWCGYFDSCPYARQPKTLVLGGTE